MATAEKDQEQAKDEVTKPMEEVQTETKDVEMTDVEKKDEGTDKKDDVKDKKDDVEDKKDDTKKDDDTKKKEPVEVVQEDEETKKNRLVDQLYKTAFLNDVTETIKFENVRANMLRNEEFIGLMTKSRTVNLELKNQVGTAELYFSPYREWMATRFLKGVNRITKEDANLKLECSEKFSSLLELMKTGKLKGEMHEQHTTKCLYVNNIQKDTTEESLKAFFPKCAKVIVPRDPEDVVLGWAVVEFSTVEDLDESIKSQTEIEIGDQKCAVLRVKAYTKFGGKFKGKGKFKKGQANRPNQPGDKAKPETPSTTKPAPNQDKSKGPQTNTTTKENDLKRKAQNQKQQQQQATQKKRKVGSMGSMGGGGGSFSYGNQNNRNRRNVGMGMGVRSLLGNPSRMMNLGIGPSVPNMMGMGGNMGGNMNMMGMSGMGGGMGNMGGGGMGHMGGGGMGNMGGGMGNMGGGGMGNMGGGGMGNMGGGGMGQGMGQGMNSMMGNNSFNQGMGGGNAKNKRNNKRGRGGGGWSDNQGNQGQGGDFRDQSTDDLSSKLTTVLSKQRMGQDNDSEMVSMLQSALKAAQKRMTEKDPPSSIGKLDHDQSRLLPANAFAHNAMASGNQKKRQKNNKKPQQSDSGSRFGGGTEGSSYTGTSYGGNVGGSYAGTDSSRYGNSGTSYGNTATSYGNSGTNYSNSGTGYDNYGTSGSTNQTSSSLMDTSYSGGYGGSTGPSNPIPTYYDQGGSTNQQSSYGDTYSTKTANIWDDFTHKPQSQSDSSYGNYRSGYY